MSLVSQQVDNLLGGVSQEPELQRAANHVADEVNGLSQSALVVQRGPRQHTAVLSATPTAAYDSVHTHLISRSSTDRFRIVLSDGDLKVFDAVTGVEETVTFPDGKTYLNTAGPARDLRCVTVGESTYITNGTVTVGTRTGASGQSNGNIFR